MNSPTKWWCWWSWWWLLLMVCHGIHTSYKPSFLSDLDLVMTLDLDRFFALVLVLTLLVAWLPQGQREALVRSPMHLVLSAVLALLALVEVLAQLAQLAGAVLCKVNLAMASFFLSFFLSSLDNTTASRPPAYAHPDGHASQIRFRGFDLLKEEDVRTGGGEWGGDFVCGSISIAETDQ